MTVITLTMSETSQPRSSAGQPQAEADSLEALVLDLQKHKDSQVLEALIRRTERACYSLAVSMLNDPELAKDALQESYFIVYRQISQLKELGAFKSWLFRIVTRTCQDIQRKRTREVETDFAEREDLVADTLNASPQSDPSRDVPKKELLKATFRALPDIDREAIALREICHLSYEEMARTLAIPIGTVRSRLAKARQRFLNAYRKEQG